MGPHRFFLVTPIHFEPLALRELLEKAPEVQNAKEVKGGIEFEADLAYGLELNYHLKIPTKILLRIGSFKAKDFPKLYNSLLKLPWRNFLRGEIPQIVASASKSRLINTTRIEETALDSFKRFNIMFPPKNRKADDPSVTQIVHLRFVDDTCEASIDTSGERLHKRSYREYTGHAPLRENLAAGLITYTLNQLKTIPDTLYDPLCGTGTFLAEAQTFYSPNFARGFHFEDFPAYKKSLKPLTYENKMPLKHFLGSDIDPKVIEQNQKQLKEFQIELFAHDAFKKSVKSIDNSLIITNPPYGKRVKIEGSQSDYFHQLISTLLQNYRPSALGILIPQEIPVSGYKNYSESTLNFKNGGIDIKFKLYQRHS